MTRITDIGTGICCGFCGDNSLFCVVRNGTNGFYVTDQGTPDGGYGYPVPLDTSRVGGVEVYTFYETRIRNPPDELLWQWDEQWGRHAQQWKLVLETLADPEKLLMAELAIL